MLQWGQNNLVDQLQRQDLKEKLDQTRKNKLTPAVPGGGCSGTGAFALASAPADGLAPLSRVCCMAHLLLLTCLPPACCMSHAPSPLLFDLDTWAVAVELAAETREDQGLVLTGQPGRRLAGLRPPFKHNVFDAIPPSELPVPA